MLREIWGAAAASFLVLAGMYATSVTPAWPQGASLVEKDNPQSKANLSTLTIVTGGYNTTSARLVSELAARLGDDGELRVATMFGRGAVQSISDLLTLKSVDLALVQTDVLAQFQRASQTPGMDNPIQYVTKLYSEEFHVLSRMQYLCLAELDGRKVNFGPRGSGSSITAEAVFEAHKINVVPLYLDQEEALEKLKAGEIDATVYVEGKPSRVFDRITYMAKVHFLDVEYSDALQRSYLPALMTNDDYPQLIAPRETVSTIAVSNALAFYSAKPAADRLKRVNRFAELLFRSVEAIKRSSEPRSLLHRKWQEVNIYSPAAGLQRLPAADEWIAQNPATGAQNHGAATSTSVGHEIKPDETPPPADNARAAALFQKLAGGQTASTPDERKELFDQFLQWYDRARKEEQPTR